MYSNTKFTTKSIATIILACTNNYLATVDHDAMHNNYRQLQFKVSGYIPILPKLCSLYYCIPHLDAS